MSKDAHSSDTPAAHDMEMIPVYTTNNPMELEILTDVFEDEDIAYFVRRKGMPGFWVNIGDQDQNRISVQEDRVDDARELIQQAIVDEAVPGDGNFIGDEDIRRIQKAKRENEE